mmetsp:Transcript_16478/g.39524  ORF Transcript_16478/g.39524 Transcript_16478/m.39524 type:complete len:259 (+) Transcript_16478:593-1369(+)
MAGAKIHVIEKATGNNIGPPESSPPPPKIIVAVFGYGIAGCRGTLGRSRARNSEAGRAASLETSTRRGELPGRVRALGPEDELPATATHERFETPRAERLRNEPARQAEQSPGPSALNLPVGQTLQGPHPVPSLYEPAAHSTHTPPSGPLKPALQVQLVWRKLAERERVVVCGGQAAQNCSTANLDTVTTGLSVSASGRNVNSRSGASGPKDNDCSRGLTTQEQGLPCAKADGEARRKPSWSAAKAPPSAQSVTRDPA